MAMTKEEHIQRHKELHRALDELFADYIQCNPRHEGSYLEMPLRNLIDWSYRQTIDPDEPKEG